VKSWDAIIVGGGVIGLSLARLLKSQGLDVLIVEKHEPAREATYAAGGMIASCDPHIPQELRLLVAASARLFPEFVQELQDESGEAVDLRGTSHSEYGAGVVVNCSGAWAAQILPLSIPTRPVKGQMVCVVPPAGAPHTGPLIQHVVRTPEVYIIPRSDGRILLGATVEEAGFDKTVDPDTIRKLHQAGVDAVPAMAKMRIHDAWAGLRPGSPDNLPILGETSMRGYYAASGHYRDGILLAPITAQLMTELITGCKPVFDLQPFSPLRFG
jgi:glycine/D-amino acid oxidase-like deaminating enzyme